MGETRAVLDKLAHGIWAGLGGEAEAPDEVYASLGVEADATYEGGMWSEVPRPVKAWLTQLIVDVIEVDGGISLGGTKPLGPYERFVVAQLADVYECPEEEVVSRIVLMWATDHVKYLSGVASISDFRARPEPTGEK